MSYEVIARKWRPQSFQEIVGQAHITDTLRNALKTDRLPHALLFTGPRGTGKTSSARVVAKTIRCLNPQDFSPCNECEVCQEITLGRDVNVIEIDGASNNGVDSIRELRETVGYMASRGSYKVYIVDEVHMLSQSAFNALLKTLEEPPAHVVFILATTEVHKIPATILSRCQRFDFRKISTRLITNQLSKICSQDGFNAEVDALWMIARQGDGSMRDAQSLLDQVISFSNGELTTTKVVEILGLTDQSLLNDVLDSLVHRNAETVLSCLKKLQMSAFDPKLFCEDLLESLRHLLLVKLAPSEAQDFLDRPDSEILILSKLAPKVSEEEIHLLFDMLLKGLQDLTRSANTLLIFEVVLLRLVRAPRIQDIGSFLKNSSPSSGEKISPEQQTDPRVKLAPKKPQGSPQEQWLAFVDFIRHQDGFFAAKLENVLFLSLKDKKLRLAVPKKLSFIKDQLSETQVRLKLLGFATTFWDQSLELEVSSSEDETKAESAQSLREKMQQEDFEKVKARILENPRVQKAQEVFQAKAIVSPIK